MKGFTYVLISLKDRRTYTGPTDDIKRRLQEHDKGYCKATRDKRPLELIYEEEFDTLDDARKREHYFKTASGRRELRKILEHIGE